MTAPSSSHVSEREPSPNGTPSHRPVPPEKKPGFLRKNAIYVWAVGLVFLLMVGVGAYVFVTRLIIGTPFTGPTWTVKKEPLRVTIVERGSLESAENSDITVRVKAGSKNATNASTIKWVVDDGAQVKAGDPVCDLDDSGYQDNLKTLRNNANTAKSNWVTAETNVTIQKYENLSKIKTAEVNLINKQIELRKYAGEGAAAKICKMDTMDDVRRYLKNGFETDVQKESATASGKFTCAYLQEVSSYEGDIENARSDRDSWLDRAAWSQRMVRKGFYSLSQADADQSRLSSMEISVRKAQGTLDIYRIFDCEQKITLKWSDVKEAERALQKETIQADSNMRQKQALEASTKAVYDQELDRLREEEKYEKYYRMAAPQDGMVVYYIPEQARFGGGAQQGTVAQGEPVREGQKLIRIPNLAKMLVNVRVHEAMIRKVEPEKTRPTGYSDALRIAFAMGHQDLFGLATYRDEVREQLKDKDQTVIFAGHRAKIRIDSAPGKVYEGHVKSKATVASQAEFFSSDVKVYQTMVSIDDLDPSQDKLNPGMSAEVTILADETPVPVLVIPIQSVVGNVTMKAERKCFVLDARGIPHERDIKVGLSNDKLVEVLEGLEEGEKIVLNPRPLIPEKSDMKVGTPGTRRGAEFDDAAKKKDGKKKGDMPQGTQGPGPDGKSFQRPDAPPPDAQDRKKR
jgi:HlyD family secretion protein